MTSTPSRARESEVMRYVTADAEGQPSQLAPDFWHGSNFYCEVYRFARARGVAPLPLLGCVLARAAACVPPSVVLPATIGSKASLNLFVGLVGESGSGKTNAMSVARDFLLPRGGCSDYLETAPGSGEGLLAAYCHVATEKGKSPCLVQDRQSVLLVVDEIGALGSLAGRNGSTLLPFLKTAWSGETLATQNAEAARLRRVDAHAYRLAMVAGVQPMLAGTILDDAEGGFPQRWLWLDVYDPDRADFESRPIDPPPYEWHVPGPTSPAAQVDTQLVVGPSPELVMTLPDEAVEAIISADKARNVPLGKKVKAGLDGHALLTRAKVAALLALIHGRIDVIADDWHRAGAVLALSDATRTKVQQMIGAEARRMADEKAARSGRSQVLTEESAAAERASRDAARMLRALEKAGREGLTSNRLKKNAFGSERSSEEVERLLDRLVEMGRVVKEDRTPKGNPATSFYVDARAAPAAPA